MNSLGTYLLIFSITLLTSALAETPTWWSSGSPPIINSWETNNKGPANIGQAKYMVSQALEALQLVDDSQANQIRQKLTTPQPHPTNPSVTLPAIIDLTIPPDPKPPSWTDSQKAPLLIGQLKAISAPFYDRLDIYAHNWLKEQLIENGTYNVGNHYPWTATNSDDSNKAIATIGQLKAVFALRFDDIPSGGFVDTDLDGLEDSWELLNFSTLDNDANGDPDRDGITNLQEQTAGSNPNAVGIDNDSNGIPDDWEKVFAGQFAVYPPILSASIMPDKTKVVPLKLLNGTNFPVNYTISVTTETVAHYNDETLTGSAFAWQDISATGTLLSDISSSDDAWEEIPGGFSFNLFGNASTAVYVSSNGFITLREGQDSINHLNLPNVSAPGAIIAPLWHDLNPGTGGDIYYKREPDRLIVQYHNVVPFSGTASYTFQIVLFTNNKIEFRYLSITGDPFDATVGIQDTTGKKGKQFNVVSTFPVSGQTIRLTPEPFIAVTPASGTIAAHSTSTVSGSYNSLGLSSGSHSAQVTTSSAGSPVRTIAAVLNIIPDTDSDGIPDEWEIEHGFDPNLDDANLDPDNDGYANLLEFENSTDPYVANNTTDTDTDGMWDRWETLHGLNPTTNDSAANPDSDGLTNLQEFQLGTDPQASDSDSDQMPDGWEHAHSLDPLHNDAERDPDGDGFSNLEEFELSTDPHVPNDISDLDDDGMLDAWEDYNGLDSSDPTDAGLDADNDGLTNLVEFQLRTKPSDPDTDEDSLPDGWEVQNSLNPKKSSGIDGKSGDPDHDGATNFAEWQYGSNPKKADTDDDGTNDGPEINQGSNPCDPADGGNPPPPQAMVSVPFRIGDPSGSHSETWTLKIKGMGPDDRRTIKISSPNYGEMAEQTHELRANNTYEITVEHLRTDPEYLENNDGPDYDWEAKVNGLPSGSGTDSANKLLALNNITGDVSSAWVIVNSDGLLTSERHGDEVNIASGFKATMVPVKTFFVDRDSPEADWPSTGDGTALPPAKPLYSGKDTGDLVKWKIPNDELGGASFTWTAERTIPATPAFTKTGPSGSNNQWKPVYPLEWKPGTYDVKCIVEKDGATAEVKLKQRIGVRTSDVVVVGWIDPDQVNLPTAGVQAPLLEVLPPGGLTAGHGNHAKIKAGLLFQHIVEVGVAAGFQIDFAFANGVDFSAFSATDKDYTLRWMFKYGANTPHPPTEFTKSSTVTSTGTVFDPTKLATFIAAADKTKHKLMNHYQVKYLVTDTLTFEGLTVRDKNVSVGNTKDPARVYEITAPESLGLWYHELMGDYPPGGVFPGKTSAQNWKTVTNTTETKLINEGQPDKKAMDAFKNMYGPTVDFHIWSTITFFSDLSHYSATTSPSTGLSLTRAPTPSDFYQGRINTQAYPTYWIYIDGIKINEQNQLPDPVNLIYNTDTAQ